MTSNEPPNEHSTSQSSNADPLSELPPTADTWSTASGSSPPSEDVIDEPSVDTSSPFPEMSPTFAEMFAVVRQRDLRSAHNAAIVAEACFPHAAPATLADDRPFPASGETIVAPLVAHPVGDNVPHPSTSADAEPGAEAALTGHLQPTSGADRRQMSAALDYNAELAKLLDELRDDQVSGVSPDDAWPLNPGAAAQFVVWTAYINAAARAAEAFSAARQTAENRLLIGIAHSRLSDYFCFSGLIGGSDVREMMRYADLGGTAADQAAFAIQEAENAAATAQVAYAAAAAGAEPDPEVVAAYSAYVAELKVDGRDPDGELEAANNRDALAEYLAAVDPDGEHEAANARDATADAVAVLRSVIPERSGLRPIQSDGDADQ